MNNELPKTKIDERTGIEYRLEGDYYIPNITLPKQEKIILNNTINRIVDKIFLIFILIHLVYLY